MNKHETKRKKLAWWLTLTWWLNRVTAKRNIYGNRYKNADWEKVIKYANTLPGMIHAKQERAQNHQS